MDGTHMALGDSPGWTHVLKQAALVAGTDTTVLVLGCRVRARKSSRG